jgi:hemerythrin-like domain-containing protein
MAANREEELALRLQEEHRALQQLSQVLKEHIAAMPSVNVAQWLEGLRIAFERLHAHLQRSFAMKEKDGYLEAITREHPTLSRQVEAVKEEHGQLVRMGFGIRNDLAGIRPEERVLLADSCARVQRYIAVLTEHEQRENLLVLFAFNQDLGAY